jgi:hypothetical protein
VIRKNKQFLLHCRVTLVTVKQALVATVQHSSDDFKLTNWNLWISRFLLTVTLYRGPDMNHKLWNIRSTCRYTPCTDPPSVSTIILSGRTWSFVGLEESVTLKIIRQNRPTKSSQDGVRVRVRVSHVGVRVSEDSQIVKL